MKDAIARVCGEPEDPPAGKPAKRWALNLDCEIEVSTSSGAKFLGRHLLSILYYKTAEASKKLGLQRA